MPNYRLQVGTDRRYEVDLWCEALQFALEVDGGQHVSNTAQRTRDARRDAELAAAGIVTVRIHAAELISDPSQVMAFIRHRIQTRRQENFA